MVEPEGHLGDRSHVSLETPPYLAANDILRLGEQHLADITETQRPHVAKTAPLRLVKGRLAWWWVRRQSARLGIVFEHLRRASRSPRNILGRRLAWLRVVSWGHLLDLRVIAASVSVLLFVIDIVWVKFGITLIWSADKVFDVGKAGTSGKDLLESVSTVLATVFGVGAAGSFALLWSEFIRSPLEAWRMRRHIRKRPVSILPTAPAEDEAETLMRDDPLEGELIPRAELYDEVLSGMLRKTRRDVQIIVGDPGSGKTTALVAVAGLLAKVGMVPVFVSLRGDKAEEIVDKAKKSFQKQVKTHMRATTDCEPLWRWLLDRKRIVALIDDIDQIGTDGERGFVLRRTLDALATKDFAVIVTARTAGIPAGVAASSIDLGPLDEESVVRYTMRAAKDVPGGAERTISERALRRWVREGRLAEVPFYLELLACLHAAGKARELPSAEVLHDEGEHSGRFRRRADGAWEWNPNWVRFKLLELFYEWLAEGSVRRWLAIERRERESTLEQLENAALGHLLATIRDARPVQATHDGSLEEAADRLPKKLQDFIDPRDREEGKFVDGQRVRVSAHEAVDAAERLRLVDRDQDLQLQFRHRIMQAYLAGRRLVRASEDLPYLTKRIEQLLDRHNPEKLTAHMTLMFAALRANDRLSHIDENDGAPNEGDNARDAEAFPKLARQMRETAVTMLIESAEQALQPEQVPEPQDPLRLTQIRDPEQRRNPDDALINLTTASEIVHALWRGEHGAQTRYRALTEPQVSQAELLQTLTPGRETTWIKVQRVSRSGQSADGGWFERTEREIVEQVHNAGGATRWTKLNAIAAIAALHEPQRWRRIWDYACDKDYKVRRAAANELQRNADDAYGQLAPEIDKLLVRAAARTALNLPIVTKTPGAHRTRHNGNGASANGQLESIAEWIEEDVSDLVALGWVLPAIVSGLREDPSRQSISEPKDRRTHDENHVAKVHQARQALAALVALAFEGGNHNVESSVAQGFKDDAMRHAEDRGGRISGPGWVASNQRLVAEICLDHAEFWYARMMLHQALALYAIAGANRRETHTIIVRLLHPSKERHEFVRRAAKLARRAVERKQVRSDLWTGLIWEDESQAVSRRASLLDDKAAQLVADTTLLLNLNEQSGEDRQVQFGHMHDLPHCLSLSRNRNEILGSGCPASCGWGLCPYEQAPPDEPDAQRGVSRAFCRQQQQIALRRHPPRWQRHIRRRALQRFWREMERRARS